METTLRVLFIEDSEDDVLILVRELERGGYRPVYKQVYTAEAMRTALAQSKWDIILSDHAMPAFSAPAALKVLQQSGLDLPFIIVSGGIGEEAAVEVMKAGAHDYIAKDNLSRLLPAIKRELREARIRAERRRAEELLRESEEKYREILASIQEGYFETDLAGNITFCNEAAGRLLGYHSREILGSNYRRFFCDPDEVFRRFNQVYRSGHPEQGLVMKVKHRDGRILFFELSISLIRDKQGRITGFRGVERDITERMLYEEQLIYLSLHDQLTGLYNRAFFEEELRRLEGSDTYPVTILSADLDGLKLINDTIGHDAGNQVLKACAGILCKPLKKGHILARIGGDEFAAIMPQTGEEQGEQMVQIIREAIESYNRQHPQLPLSISLGLATSTGTEQPLQETLKQADSHMYRDKLYRSASARGQIVKALLAALSERDYIANGHAVRLQVLCQKLAQRIGLSSRHMTDLSLLAQVHDLGKVGIPDSILFKKGPLTEKEWEIMRQHSEKGYRIACSSPDLAPVADLILRHHERWDGSGYPLGLKGEEIPVECRILAIVDAFDAMTNERPYSKKKTYREAREELRRCAGTQFDPNLVEEFLQIIEEDETSVPDQ